MNNSVDNITTLQLNNDLSNKAKGENNSNLNIHESKEEKISNQNYTKTSNSDQSGKNPLEAYLGYKSIPSELKYIQIQKRVPESRNSNVALLKSSESDSKNNSNLSAGRKSDLYTGIIRSNAENAKL